MQPNFESISLYGEKEKVNAKIKIENKTDLSVEENKIIFKTARVFLKTADVENGNLKYSVRAVFYCGYYNAEGQIKKYESGVDYDGEITLSDMTDKTLSCVDFDVLKVDAEQDNGSFTFVAGVNVCASFDVERKINALSGGEELICDNFEYERYALVVNKKTTFPAVTDFELTYGVKEVMALKAEPIIKEVQCGVGTVIVDGDILLHALLLQNDEKGCIINERKSFSFRAEIDAEEVSPEDIASVCANVKSQKIDISVDEGKNVSLANVIVNLFLSVKAYKKETIALTNDAFCKQNEIELIRENVSGTVFETTSVREIDCDLTANINANEKQLKFVGTTNERVELSSMSSDENFTNIDCVVSYTVLFCDDAGKIYCDNVEAPVSVKTEKLDDFERADCFTADLYDVNVEGDNVVCKCKLVVTIVRREKAQIKYISSATVGGEKKTNESAISVYIALNGEDSWSLAKRLNVTPEELLMLNGDLSFPLSGKERIVVYRKK